MMGDTYRGLGEGDLQGQGREKRGLLGPRSRPRKPGGGGWPEPQGAFLAEHRAAGAGGVHLMPERRTRAGGVRPGLAPKSWASGLYTEG